MNGAKEPDKDERPLLLRRPPTWSVEHQRGEPERPGFNAWDDRVRSRQNIIAAVLVAVLGVVTYMVFDELRSSSRRLTCIEAGHRNCGNPIIPGNGHR
jgi:hypothetical protein